VRVRRGGLRPLPAPGRRCREESCSAGPRRARRAEGPRSLAGRPRWECASRRPPSTRWRWPRGVAGMAAHPCPPALSVWGARAGVRRAPAPAGLLGGMATSSLTRPGRVGHKGAAHIEPGNTLASFDAALRHGVDMIELDVLSEHSDGSGRLLVAHDYEDLHARNPLSFERALEHLSG